MAQIRLTDEELSRVLTASANGDLSYWDTRFCVGGCAVVTAPSEGDISPGDALRFWRLSSASCQFGGSDYPNRHDPDGFLRFLELKGLA